MNYETIKRVQMREVEMQRATARVYAGGRKLIFNVGHWPTICKHETMVGMLICVKNENMKQLFYLFCIASPSWIMRVLCCCCCCFFLGNEFCSVLFSAFWEMFYLTWCSGVCFKLALDLIIDICQGVRSRSCYEHVWMHVCYRT